MISLEFKREYFRLDPCKHIFIYRYLIEKFRAIYFAIIVNKCRINTIYAYSIDYFGRCEVLKLMVWTEELSVRCLVNKMK